MLPAFYLFLPQGCRKLNESIGKAPSRVSGTWKGLNVMLISFPSFLCKGQRSREIWKWAQTISSNGNNNHKGEKSESVGIWMIELNSHKR